MSEAVDVLHAIENLVSLVDRAPATDANVLRDVDAILFRMGLGKGAKGYKAEKLTSVRDAFRSWFSARGPHGGGGDDPQALRQRLLLDIEHLRKALARGSEGQD